jgi:hypothetical protein
VAAAVPTPGPGLVFLTSQSCQLLRSPGWCTCTHKYTVSKASPHTLALHAHLTHTPSPVPGTCEPSCDHALTCLGQPWCLALPCIHPSPTFQRPISGASSGADHVPSLCSASPTPHKVLLWPLCPSPPGNILSGGP